MRLFPPRLPVTLTYTEKAKRAQDTHSYCTVSFLEFSSDPSGTVAKLLWCTTCQVHVVRPWSPGGGTVLGACEKLLGRTQLEETGQ